MSCILRLRFKILVFRGRFLFRSGSRRTDRKFIPTGTSPHFAEKYECFHTVPLNRRVVGTSLISSYSTKLTDCLYPTICTRRGCGQTWFRSSFSISESGKGEINVSNVLSYTRRIWPFILWVYALDKRVVLQDDKSSRQVQQLDVVGRAHIRPSAYPCQAKWIAISSLYIISYLITNFMFYHCGSLGI